MSLKILGVKQIKEADQYTIEHENITSVDLMERAAAAFVRAYVKDYTEKQPILVFSGTGNNGGDGLAIARLLQSQQFKVQAYVVRVNGKATDDFNTNFERLQKFQDIQDIRKESDIPEIPEDAVVLDALFGSGLSRPIEGLYAKVIEAINKSKAEVVSVDIPSGLFIDQPAHKEGAIVRADLAITFHLPKLAFMLPENGKYVRNWKMVNIGLSKEYIEKAETPYCYVDPEMIKKIHRQRDKWSHKGDFGRVLIIAGSKGKIGAGVLCCKACLRSGAGLLTVQVPECGYVIVQTAVPEAMAITDPSETEFSKAPDISNFDTIGIGPGLGTDPDTVKAMRNLLESCKRPMVLDADALNIISKNKDLMELVPENSILTPHPKEFQRLTGEWKNGYERLEMQIEFCKKYKVILVVKGAHTSISLPDGKVYFNSTGNPGMATGGTGDVLTGMLTGLLGQQYSPADAAIFGVYLHGLAGDLVIKDKGYEALIASDIIDYLPQAYQKIASDSFV